MKADPTKALLTSRVVALSDEVLSLRADKKRLDELLGAVLDSCPCINDEGDWVVSDGEPDGDEVIMFDTDYIARVVAAAHRIRREGAK